MIPYLFSFHLQLLLPEGDAPCQAIRGGRGTAAGLKSFYNYSEKLAAFTLNAHPFLERALQVYKAADSFYMSFKLHFAIRVHVSQVQAETEFVKRVLFTTNFSSEAVNILSVYACALKAAVSCTIVNLAFKVQADPLDIGNFVQKELQPAIRAVMCVVDVNPSNYKLDMFDVIETGLNRFSHDVHVSLQLRCHERLSHENQYIYVLIANCCFRIYGRRFELLP